MKNLKEIIATTVITGLALVIGCAITPKPGQFDESKVVLSPLGTPAHPAIMLFYAGKSKCTKIEKEGKIIGIRAVKNHWTGLPQGRKEIYFPENAEDIALAQGRGDIIITYQLGGKKFREEYGSGLSPNAKDIKLEKRQIYNPKTGKWEKTE